MKIKNYVLIICNLVICLPLGNLLIAQNITNTLGSSGTFTIKDGATTYLSLSQLTGSLSLNMNLTLQNTTSSSVGVIYKGIESFAHNYGVNNTFLGNNAGNFTMTGFGHNTALGRNSLISNVNGYYNTAVGAYSMYYNTTGYSNTAIGNSSLISNTTGFQNTALGMQSLYFNVSGNLNTALGYNTLYYNTAGSENTAIGDFSLAYNTTGANNTAMGVHSLYSNSTAYGNTAIGWNSLFYNSTGNENTGVGMNSLYSNTTGFYNSSIGSGSLGFNTTGYSNTAMGWRSLYFNTGGNSNTAVGDESLYSVNTGSQNTAIGVFAGYYISSGTNLTCIGYNALSSTAFATNQVTLGNNQITSLRCNVQTITSLSDARDKKNVTDLSLGLDFIAKLKPRQFNWDKREWYNDNISDGSKIQEAPTAGFIAQELDEVQSVQNAQWLNLVLKDNPDKWEATYGNLLPVMVKAIQELKAENDKLKSEVGSMKTIEERLAKLEGLMSEQNKLKEAKLTER